MADAATTETIYVFLLNEGTDTWRPTTARRVDDVTFNLLPTPNYDPGDEEWEFVPGTTVQCELRTLSCGPVLVAVARAAR